MNKVLGYFFTLVFFILLSCSSEQRGDQNKENKQIDETPQEKPLDSKFDTYQAIMVGYDTAVFSQHYEKRITPPAINLNQSLENLSVSDLFILRNTLLAMKGKVFEDAILYGYFQKIAWYQPPFWDDKFEVDLNEEEMHFLNRVDRKMNQLKEGNLAANKIPIAHNAINRFQYESLSSAAWDQIERNGFVILDQPCNQPTNQYIANYYDDLPPIITTDMVLQQLHLFYGSLENEIEAVYLSDILKTMLEIINVELYSSYEKTLDPTIEKAIEESLLYYSIPYAVITGNKTNLIGNYTQIYFNELTKVLEGAGTGSKVIKNNNFNYQIFKPYAQYTKNDKTEKYYKAITWLQRINLCLNDEDEFYRAILIAYIINRSPDLKNSYKEYMELKTYFSSQKEQFTFWDLADVINRLEGIKVFEDLFKEQTMSELKDMLGLKDSESCQIRVSLMPVEYQNLYTDLSQSIKDSDNPTPIQLFAALQNHAAISMAGSQTNEAAIMENLLKISTQEEAKSIDWLSTLLTGLDNSDGMPPIMNQDPWKMKNLNAALAAWVQLNERVNIQVKKVSVEESRKEKRTVLIGYVEPNIVFFDAATTLLQNTSSFFMDRHMLSKNSSANIKRLTELLIFLKSISQKQITNQQITPEEYRQIASMGTTFQELAFSYLNLNYSSETHELANNIAYATDVFQGGKDKNHISGIGQCQVILVPVEIDGYIYLTQGSVYSYYEITNYSKTYINQNEWVNILANQDKYSLTPLLKDYYLSHTTPDAGVVARK